MYGSAAMLRSDVKNALVIAAHPDDEALGCGGTMARLSANDIEVHVLFLSDGVNARGTVAAGAIAERRRMGDDAAEALGVNAPVYFDFPDNRLDSVDLLDVIVAIERHAAAIRPQMVLTHFPGDLNIDHRICAQAVVTAFRPVPGQSAKIVCGFEVPSSTDWACGVAGYSFVPDVFVDISDHLVVKVAALQIYAEEMRPYPHPRSIEAVQACARWRGATVGVDAAEAFCLLRALY